MRSRFDSTDETDCTGERNDQTTMDRRTALSGLAAAGSALLSVGSVAAASDSAGDALSRGSADSSATSSGKLEARIDFTTHRGPTSLNPIATTQLSQTPRPITNYKWYVDREKYAEGPDKEYISPEFDEPGKHEIDVILYDSAGNADDAQRDFTAIPCESEPVKQFDANNNCAISKEERDAAIEAYENGGEISYDGVLEVIQAHNLSP